MKDDCELEILCLCSMQTEQTLSAFPFVRDVHRTRTTEEALRALRTDRFDVFVVSLDYTDEVSANCLVNSDKLMTEAYYYSPGMMRIAYSESAVVANQLTEACFLCGADAVLCSQKQLQTSLEEFFSNPESNNESQIDNYRKQTSTRCSRLLSLAPALRESRENVLLKISSGQITHRVEQTRELRLRHEEQIKNVNLRLGQEYEKRREQTGNDDNDSRTNEPNDDKTTIRIVHMSDTHNLHDLASSSIPKGDLFLHTGDFCANYDAQRNLRTDLPGAELRAHARPDSS